MCQDWRGQLCGCQVQYVSVHQSCVTMSLSYRDTAEMTSGRYPHSVVATHYNVLCCGSCKCSILVSSVICTV